MADQPGSGALTLSRRSGLARRLVRSFGGDVDATGSGVVRHEVAPGEIMLIADDAAGLPEPGVDDAGERLVVDLSAAQTAFRVSGNDARAVIAKGAAIDLHDSRFAVGATALCRFGAFRVLLCRPAEDAYDLHVNRSLDEPLRELLLEFGAEFRVVER